MVEESVGRLLGHAGRKVRSARVQVQVGVDVWMFLSTKARPKQWLAARQSALSAPKQAATSADGAKRCQTVPGGTVHRSAQRGTSVTGCWGAWTEYARPCSVQHWCEWAAGRADSSRRSKHINALDIVIPSRAQQNGFALRTMATQQFDGGVPFAIAASVQKLQLLELPPDVAALLESPNPPRCAPSSRSAAAWILF